MTELDLHATFYRCRGLRLTVMPAPEPHQYRLVVQDRNLDVIDLEQYSMPGRPQFRATQVWEAIRTLEGLATQEEAQERFWAYQWEQNGGPLRATPWMH